MANSLLKQIAVQFADGVGELDDQLIMSKNVDKFESSGEEFQRSNDTIWRPRQNIAISNSGMDATSAFSTASSVQLGVPANLGYSRFAVIKLDGKELRDRLTKGTLVKSAIREIASYINGAVTDAAALQLTNTIKRTTAATGLDDLVLADALLTTTGVTMYDRKAAFNAYDYNGVVSNLGAKETLAGSPQTAWAKARFGETAGFEIFKADYTSRLTAAAGVTVTLTGQVDAWDPVATTTQSDGSVTPKENRYQTVGITVTSGTVKVNDRFTIGGAGLVNSVHGIRKVDTGQKKTFVITEIVTGAGGTGTVKISPPIIIGSTQGQLQYQNVSSLPVSGAALTFLNTVAAPVNLFWQKNCIELIPGKYEIPDGMGVQSLTATTESGMPITMSYSFNNSTMTMEGRIDAVFGVCVNEPENGGIILFNQS
jgi:hypothetical protein